MANEEKILKKAIKHSWRVEFPFLKPVDLDEIPRIPKGCNYLCDDYGAARERYYFIRLIFSPKCRGNFSLVITVSPSPKKSILDQTKNSPTPSPTSTGMYGIWKFLNRQRFDWELVDLTAEHNALFAKLGVTEFRFEASRSPNVWRPTSYDQPFDKIVDEAIAHVNQVLSTSVFPVLQILT